MNVEGWLARQRVGQAGHPYPRASPADAATCAVAPSLGRAPERGPRSFGNKAETGVVATHAAPAVRARARLFFF
eukprot:CAMPEP_0170371964 /NCGR_PEP_ID=MMETSP0117_2-20130122/9306_1 /TAXON_ID=400756 /ORGANISM="Durinskia baltica, Strain CSIRO CS-38" /LENGTH=73 /DNA_ID=CAMNT_0010626803 /DNA_START=23 /DNA_END=241 /DNA_ORIENTATION=+